jgi:predicted dehydrogenase
MTTKAMPVTLACVGAGYWGKNLVRVFHELAEVRLKMVCDPQEKVRQAIQAQYRDLQVVAQYQEVLADPEVEGVVLAVPAVDHFALARQALERGKHAYVEKPLALRASQARELVELAESRGRVLMVGHLLEYHPAVELLKKLVQQGELGDIYYLYAQRVNLGIVRRDENALWSLAPHDIAVLLYLLEQEPEAVSARGASYLQKGVEDVVFANLHFADGKMAQIQVSWLDPHRIRKLTIVGSRKMAVFDDVESTEKIRLYDKAAEPVRYDSYGEAIALRFGDVVIPHLHMVEPLKLECQHFAECVRGGKTPRSDGRDGLRVVRVLEAAQRSLEQGGAPVSISR